MSGRTYGRRTVEPVDLTEDEVRELAGRRAKPVAAVARIKRLVPAESTGRLISDLDAPARITRKELPILRQAGKRPDKIVSRLTPSELPAEQVVERKDQRLTGPTKKPPVAES